MASPMLSLFFFLAFSILVRSQFLSRLGNFPLAVKTPYLNSWLLNNRHNDPHQTLWSQLFTQHKILGWDGIIRVDNVSYEWLGDSGLSNFPTRMNSQITPTRTIFTIHAGPVNFNVTFFSPIEINDYIRQSMPFTYLFVDGITANDAKPHTIQLYSDVTAEWVSSDTSTDVTWDKTLLDNTTYLHFNPPGQMTRNTDSPEDAAAVYAMAKRSGLTWQIGSATDIRIKFSKQGSLPNSTDDNYRPVDRNGDWPVLSFAVDLGLVMPDNQPSPVVWALGLVRDTLVNYVTQSGAQNRTGYYKSVYQNTNAAVSAFLGDFENARSRGQAFDDGITKAASSISPEYAEILSLVTRQVFASMDITIPAESGGLPSTSDVKIFMKDVSVSTRANPVEVIYGALPALLYFNASFVRDLLLPLFEAQSSSSSYPYASSDLGNTYPIINGSPNPDQEHAIEQCGNMLIMAYAHAVKSGDGSLISNPKYRLLLENWANYLVQNSLHPNNSVSADGISYSGMSNLALKGILGIYSMGKINEAIKSSDTALKDKASELFNEWKQLAAPDTHIQAEYGRPDTWGLMYNLFPAVWLETGLIDDDFLNREAQFYLNHTPPGDQSYSIDNDKGNDLAYPHWALMTAAAIPPNFKSVRDSLIKSTHDQAYNASQGLTLPITYRASTGDAINGSLGSAIQGAAFAILAKDKPNVPIILPDHKRTPVGAIAGGVIGGVAFLLIVAGAIFFWRRRRVRQPKVVIDPHYETRPYPFGTLRASGNNPNSTSQIQKGSAYTDSDGRGDYDYPLLTATPLVQSSRLSHTGRDALRENQSELAESVPLDGLSARPERRESWRAEVEDLRREMMEAIRGIERPPPSYE